MSARWSDDSEGFSLAEVIVAIGILVAVAAASAPFLINSLQVTVGLGSRQTAVSIANQQLNYIRSLSPSTLESGRAYSDVQALNSSPGLVNLSQDVLPASTSDCSNTPVECDITASSPSTTAVVPLTQTQTVKGIVYTVRTFINICYLTTSGSCTKAQATSAPYYPAEYRVDVDVSWPKAGAVSCASALPGNCEYTVTTVRDPTADPTFSINTDYPVVTTPVSASPSVIHPGEQVTLSIHGTGFQYATQVAAQVAGDATGIPTTNAAGTLITVSYTPGLNAGVGSHSLGVINTDGTSTTTSVSVTASLPSVTSVAVAGGTKTPVTQTFTITGSDFYTSAAKPIALSLSINGTAYPATNVVLISATQVSGQFYFGSATSVSGTFTVTNPDLVGATSSAYAETLS